MSTCCTFGPKRRSKQFFGKRIIKKATVFAETRVEAATVHETPQLMSVSSKKLTTEPSPAPSTGFTSRVSAALLHPRSIGDASSSVAENNLDQFGNRFISYSR